MNAEVLNTDTRVVAMRHGRNLAYLTIGWNSLEAVAAVIIGALAGSIALVSFGIDSVIEVSSGAIILWRLFAGDHRGKLALKLVGISLIALAAYVAFDAVKSLVLREPPQIKGALDSKSFFVTKLGDKKHNSNGMKTNP